MITKMIIIAVGIFGAHVLMDVLGVLAVHRLIKYVIKQRRKNRRMRKFKKIVHVLTFSIAY